MSKGAFNPFDDISIDEECVDQFKDYDRSAPYNNVLAPWWAETRAGSEQIAGVNDKPTMEAQDSDLFDAPFLFPDDPMSGSPSEEQNTIHMTIHEQLIATCDGNDNAPSCQIEGSINVRSSNDMPFNLVIMDRNGQLESFREDPKFCINLSPALPNANGLIGDRLLRIGLPNDSAKKVKVASYSCNSSLRPIPLLVKSKAEIEGNTCTVGLKIRSNPNQERPLTQIAIIMAVPPDIRGETVRLSRPGGIWDGMKRIVAWSIDHLDPGELIEIQSQFDFVKPDMEMRTIPKFPILVRCEGMSSQFSNLELFTDSFDQSSIPVAMSLSRTVRIIFRKV